MGENIELNFDQLNITILIWVTGEEIEIEAPKDITFGELLSAIIEHFPDLRETAFGEVPEWFFYSKGLNRRIYLVEQGSISLDRLGIPQNDNLLLLQQMATS